MLLKSECSEHQFKCRGAGYGYLQHRGKQVLAHRLAYCQANGLDISDIDAQVVRHKCDNPKCVNPEHLELGTQADNIADMHSRGRGLKGEMIGNSKLTDEQAEEIRRLYNEDLRGRRAAGMACGDGLARQLRQAVASVHEQVGGAWRSE